MEFEDEMDSWGVGDAEADDIGAYVAAKNEKRRLRDTRKAFAPVSKQYGYQEPVSMLKPRPRVVTGLDNGGWDFSTQNAVIPRYNWHDDPLRKKVVPRMIQTSPRDKPSARSSSHPLRSGLVPLKPLSSRRPGAMPPIASNLFDPSAKAESQAPAPAGRADDVPLQNRQHEVDSAPPGTTPRALETERRALPSISKPTLKAYSAPTVRRPPMQLPPLLMKRAQSNTARGVGAQRRAPSTSPPRPKPRYPAEIPAGQDGGEVPTSGRRGTAEEVTASLPPPPPPVDACAELEAAIENLRAAIAGEKSQRTELGTRRSDLAHDLDDTQKRIQSSKQDIKMSEKSQKALVAAEKEHSTLLSNQRKLDVQLRDFNRMYAAASARVDEHRVQRAVASNPVSPRGTSDADMAGDRMMLRGAAKSKEAIRARVAELKNELTYLLDEVARVQVAQNDRMQRDGLIRDRIARERKAAVEELKSRLQAEIDREVMRMKENHAKAHRHRERELETHAAQEAADAEQGLKRLDATVVGGSNLSKAVSEARIQLATQTAIAEELAAQCATKQQNLDRLMDTIKTKRSKAQDLTNSIAAAERQKEMAGTSDSSAAANAKYDQERTALRDRVNKLKSEEAALVEGLQEAESQLKAEQQRQQTRRDATANRAALLSAELTAAQAEVTDAEASRKVAKLKLKTAKDQAAAIDAKDAVIETLTKRLAEAKRANADVSARNTTLLEQLDQGERLLSVSGAS